LVFSPPSVKPMIGEVPKVQLMAAKGACTVSLERGLIRVFARITVF
jgi:hypothetical protein